MRISELTLYSENLSEQIKFYKEVLKCQVLVRDSNEFMVNLGESHVIFKKSNQKQQYHFAINIPSNQIMQAREWLISKVSFLPFENEEIIQFTSWNAVALYFYDKDFNIVELIARKNMNVISNDPFSSNSFLHISEIGLPTKNVNHAFNYLNSHLGLEKYSGDLNRFCAVGSETGLFIIINYNIKKWIPNMESAYPYPFDIKLENGKRSAHLRFANDQFLEL